MDRKKDIIQIIEKMSGKYPPYSIFTDWVKCAALTIQGACYPFHDELWHAREKEFTETIGKYSEDEIDCFSRMLSLLTETMEDEMSDVLGDIYMKSGMGSKSTGQFFTPFHISELCARASLQDSITSFDGKMVQINEPSCGGGGMIIAAAKVLRDAGINYQRYMDVIAQDLDWNGVYMTYLQCSLYGIKATVVQGNTLADPFVQGVTGMNRIMKTPAKMGALI